MKVLHCFHKYLENTQNWCYRLLENLSEIEIYITTEKFLRNNFYNSAFRFIEFPIYYIEQPKGERLHFIRLLNLAISKIRKLYFRYLMTHAKEINILHSHFGPTAWMYHPISEKLGIPHVVSFYGYDYESLPFKQPIYEERYKILFKEAAFFICEGTHGAKILENKGCPKDKIRIVRLGVTPEKIPFVVRNKKQGELKLVQIASFREKKGHIYSLQAFIKIQETCPNSTLTFVGGSAGLHFKQEVVKLVQEEGLMGKVKFIEDINFDKLYEFLFDYHVFIHPSCYTGNLDSEGGAPVVLLDAQATGMPVISTRHCDIPDEVIDEVTGLLCDERNVEDLSKNIIRFYNMEQEEYSLFSRNARTHIENFYDMKINAKTLQNLYKELEK
jgi:colanic acid/amylovoran biosynthesis glycosyltransferase